MSKTRVAVLRGGPSEEYEVSLRTGSAVLKALDRKHYDPIDIIITRTGEWLYDGRSRYPESILPTVDVVFNALHGSYGEDGTVQRILDRFGVAYTGSGAYASGIAMHKEYTKEHLKDLDIFFPQHVRISRNEYRTGHQHAGEIRSRFGREYIIKPLSSGSSVGTIHVQNTLELGSAIERSLAQYPDILVEEFIAGREVTCGVIERFRDHALYALPPIEIIPPPTATFFSNEVKYNGTTQEICPTSLPLKTKHMIESAARAVHTALNLSQYSRSDFILSGDKLYFLEVNTLPGLTNESLFPKALHAVGATYPDFIHHLVKDACSTK